MNAKQWYQRREMGFQDNKLILFSSLLLLLLVYVGSAITLATSNTATLSLKSFPAGFVFGTASSSYQYEGAVREGGRKPSIWDTYTHQYPGKIVDGSNGDIADDSYHKYKEDVRIMKEIGMDAYRFSISWSRMLPSGKPSGGVNKEGISYYNRLINELLSKGIQPYVTIFHWDLPQTLEDEYAGFLSCRIVEDFKKYAEICFKEFGDRVKHWITINEPSTFCLGGYANGTLAPGRCSQWQQLNCTGGDSATESYIVAHNMLLAHAATVQLYKQKFQTSQKGKIGITLLCNWMVPYSDAKHNQNAALRALDFMYGWFMDPLTHGDYPCSMRLLVAERLPKFTKEQSMLVKGSFDFIGLNYYTAYYAAYEHLPSSTRPSYLTDARVNQTTQRNGIPIGPPTASSWLHIYPKGLYDVLLYTKTKYKNPLIYITENGMGDANNASISLKEALADHTRIYYYHQHLSNLSRAMQNGVNVNGFFAWSLLDNFQWQAGYTVRFGINFVDFKNGLKRYPKLSAHWFKTFLKK